MGSRGPSDELGVKSLVGQIPLVLNDTEEDSWGIGVGVS